MTFEEFSALPQIAQMKKMRELVPTMTPAEVKQLAVNCSAQLQKAGATKAEIARYIDRIA